MDYQKMINWRNSLKEFGKTVGVEITKVDKGTAEGEVQLNETHLNPRGIVHGGCIFTLMDTVTACAAMTHGNAVTTSSCHVMFMRPVIQNSPSIKAVATEIKSGKSLLLYDSEVFSADGKLVAKATFTFFRLESKLNF